MAEPLSLTRRKSIVRAAILLVIAAAVFFLIMPRVCAADSLSDALTDEIKEIAAESGGHSELNEIREILLGTNSQFQEAMVGENGLGSLIIPAIQIIAMGMVALYIGMEILREAEREALDFDFLLRILTKITIAVFCIFFIVDIVNALQQFGNDFVKVISDKAAEIEEQYRMGAYYDDVAKTIEIDGQTIGLWEVLPSLIEVNSFANPLLQLLKITIKTVSYSFFLELAIRKAFMPIAMVSIIDAGYRSPGVRYLKKFVCVYIKIAIVLLAVAAANMIVFTTDMMDVNSGVALGLGEAVTTLYDAAVVKSAAVYFIKSGSEIAEDVMGVR